MENCSVGRYEISSSPEDHLQEECDPSSPQPKPPIHGKNCFQLGKFMNTTSLACSREISPGARSPPPPPTSLRTNENGFLLGKFMRTTSFDCSREISHRGSFSTSTSHFVNRRSLQPELVFADAPRVGDERPEGARGRERKREREREKKKDRERVREKRQRGRARTGERERERESERARKTPGFPGNRQGPPDSEISSQFL